jgi:acetyl esterase/lipase
MRVSRLITAPLLALFAAACSPLTAFDTLVPKDNGGRLVASGVAYGAGPRRVLDVYAPRKGPAGAHPVVVFFYGGSWNSGDRGAYRFVGRALAARGFVTIIPDYRLVPEVTYPGFVEDGAAAVRWARAHARDYGGDGERIILAGHSAGAYIAAMLAVDGRWLGADREAVRGLVGLAGPYDFAPFDVPASKAAFGAWPRPDETQPVTHADAGAPPALLLTGSEDTTVRPRNSEALAKALREAGVEAEVKRYPGIGHIGILTAVARPFRGKAPVVADVADFAARVTK